MTELQLYKFVTENEMIGDSIMDEEGIECKMKSGYFCFWMDEICEYHNIETEKVFKKTN